MGIPWVWAFYTNAIENNGLLNDPTASGTVTYVDGKIGYAINCETTDVINFEDSDVLNNDHHTIAFWMKMTGTTAGYNEILLSSNNGSGSNRSPLLMQTNSDVARFHFRYTDTGLGSGGVNQGINDFGESTSTSFTLDQWYHIVLIKDGSLIKLYLNGDFVEQASTPLAYPSLAGRQLQIANGSAEIYLNDLRIYPSVLNAHEIKELARGLIYHYKLNGSAQDSSGYNAHGIESSVEYSEPKRSNDAIIHDSYGIFDESVDSGISISDGNLDRIKKAANDTFTVSMWFRTSGYISHGSIYNCLIALNDGGGDTFSFAIYFESDNTFRVFSNGTNNDTSISIPLNQWNHLVFVKTPTAFKIYMNGSIELNSSETISSQTETSSILYIGKDGSSNIRNMTGNISDVRIYATELNSNDVEELYKTRAKLSKDGSLKSNSLRIKDTQIPGDGASYIVTETSGTHNVYSHKDDNDIYLNGVFQFNLANAGDTNTVSAVVNDRLTGTKPFDAGGNDIQQLCPTSWNGYCFSYSLNRITTVAQIQICSLNDEIDYEVFLDGVNTYTGTISVGGHATLNPDTLGVYRIELSKPGCVFIEDVDGNDSYPLYPITEELITIPSSVAVIVASSEGTTNFTYYLSDGTKGSFSLTQDTIDSVTGNASFAAPSVRIIADKPFSAQSYADGGGTESTVALPIDTMGHKHVLSHDAGSWVAFAGLKENATISVYNDSGTLVGTETMTGGGVHSDGTILPTHLKISNDLTYLNTAGWTYISTDPVFCFSEDAGGNEHHVYGSSVKGNPTYSKIELPTRGGIIGVEKINEVGVDTDDLIFWTPFNNGPKEISGHSLLAHTYTGNGEPIRINNQIGEGAYRFDNTSGDIADYYIEYSTLPYTSVNASGEITVSTWVYIDNSSILERETFVSWHSAFLFSHSASNKFEFNAYDNNLETWNNIVSTTSPSANTWYHVVVTYDGTNLRLYLDGIEDKVQARTVEFINSSTQVVRVGDATWSGEAFSGRISQTMILSRALSVKEINILYKKQSNSSSMQRLNDGSLIISGISDTANG